MDARREGGSGRCVPEADRLPYPPRSNGYRWCDVACHHRGVANTAILRYKVEPAIRAELKAEFGQSFRSQVLTLPGGAAREFDAVSDDRSVVISIKTSSGLTSGGNVPSGKINGCVADLYYLSLLDAPVRRLVLTNPEFHEIFIKRMAGALPDGVEVKLVPLSPDLQAEVDRVIREASREIDRGKVVQEVAAAIEEEVEGAPGVPGS